MTLTVIFKVIDKGYNTFSADLGLRVIFVRFCPRTYYFLFTLNGDGQEIYMRKYLKTVDFIDTENIMFKINHFKSLEYCQQIRNYMTLKIKVKVIIHQ